MSTPDIQNLITVGKESLERVVADGESFLPLLLVEAGGVLSVVGLAVDTNPVDLIPATLAAIPEGTIDSVSFTADTYVANSMDAPRPYQAAFEAGDPRVSEALVITVVARGHDDIVVLLPYVRTAGRLEWGEEKRQQGEGMGGRITEALRRAIAGSWS